MVTAEGPPEGGPPKVGQPPKSPTETTLLDRLAEHDPIPLYGSPEYEQADRDTQIVSMWRAAECWRRQFTPEAVHAALVDEDRAFAKRIRRMSHDLAGGGGYEGPWWRGRRTAHARAKAGW